MNDTIRYQNKPLDFVRLLGKGKGGYSYLVTDGTRQYVAKKIHHEPSEFYDFGDDKFGAEVNAYKRLEKLNIQIPRLLEVNKAQEYLIKEYIEGDLASDLIACGDISTDMLLDVFHISEVMRAEDLNIDYFPTNFVFRDGVAYYIDFEINDYLAEWDFTHWGIYYWLNQEGMKWFNQTGEFELLHPDPKTSKPRTLGFETQVAELKALYQQRKVTL